MNELVDRFSNFVKGCIAGFDRIVFKGMFLTFIKTEIPDRVADVAPCQKFEWMTFLKSDMQGGMK